MLDGKLSIGIAVQIGPFHCLGAFGIKGFKTVCQPPCLALGDKPGLGTWGGILHKVQPIITVIIGPRAQTVNRQVAGKGDQPGHAPTLGRIIATSPQPNPCENLLQGILRLCAFL